MTFDITPILEAIITIIVIIIAKWLIPWIKSKVSAESQETLKGIISIAVSAAEQIFSGSGRGEEKKEWVLDWLSKRGLSVDADMLDGFVEAAVHDLQD